MIAEAQSHKTHETKETDTAHLSHEAVSIMGEAFHKMHKTKMTNAAHLSHLSHLSHESHESHAEPLAFRELRRRCLAPSGLGMFLTIEPRALPWAGMGRPFGAAEGGGE